MDARSYSTPESREPAHEGDRCISGASVAVGACLCETVNYAVDRVFEALSQYSDPPGARQQTEQFGTFVTAPREAFGRVSGKGSLTDYDSAGGARPSFCRWCGSTMPVTAQDCTAMLCPVSRIEIPVAANRSRQVVPA